MPICVHIRLYANFCTHTFVCQFVYTYVCMPICVDIRLYANLCTHAFVCHLCTHTFVCQFVNTYVCMSICVHIRLYANLSTHMFVSQFVYTYVCMPIYVHIRLYANLCTHTLVCQFVYTYVCMPICVHIRLYTNLCTHTFVCQFPNHSSTLLTFISRLKFESSTFGISKTVTDRANIIIAQNSMSHVGFRIANLTVISTFTKGQLGCRNGDSPNISTFLLFVYFKSTMFVRIPAREVYHDSTPVQVIYNSYICSFVGRQSCRGWNYDVRLKRQPDLRSEYGMS